MGTPQQDFARWRQAVASYVGGDVVRSVTQLVVTHALLAFVLLCAYWAVERSLLVAAFLCIVSGGLFIRSFIMMHDCVHGSFLPSRLANDIVGYITGVINLTPFDQWRREHALHHASSGDLDRRGYGDVTTWTVKEYLSKTPMQRLGYRIIRNPVLLLLFGPLYLMIGQRMRRFSMATRGRQITNVWTTNLGMAILYTILVWAFGWTALWVYLGSWYVAGFTGIWLFYIQHQFEDAYWESHDNWDYATAAVKGSSHLKLPALFQWFTGSIGLHHIHHLAPRIPNYRLQECHDANPEFHIAPVVTVRSGMAALNLALWDEDRRRLVRFRDLPRQDRLETRLSA